YYHESEIGGHYGILKTTRKICDLFYHADLAGLIKDKVKMCEACALAKTELNASRAEIVVRLEEQVAVLLVNRASQPQDLRGRRTAPTARSLGELCIDSTSTTSLGNGDGDGYLRTDTGRRAILPHHPLGLRITAST
ncbi:hypothetical protein J6590_052724, partial [Homalodisca vitripennis]